MKSVIRFPDPARTQEEAASWIARLDRGDLDSAEREALRVWLAAAPSHRRALERMAQLWGALDCMAVLAELFPLDVATPQRRWQQRATAAALGAAALFAIVAVGWNLQQSRHDAPSETIAQVAPSELVYRTGLGERTVVPLDDGSVVTLNTQSEIRVRYDNATRNIQLSRGEAHFKVAKNPQRPFVVFAGHGSVRALGTAFNVRVADQQVEVVVNEGVVEVQTDKLQTDKLQAEKAQADKTPIENMSARTAASAASERSVVLKQGSAVSYSGRVAQPQALPPQRIEQRLAWRRGKWMFEGETLAEVLGEVARYSDRRIVIADPALASLRIGGYFDIGDVDGLMSALESGFGIRVESDGTALKLHTR